MKDITFEDLMAVFEILGLGEEEAKHVSRVIIRRDRVEAEYFSRSNGMYTKVMIPVKDRTKAKGK